MGTYYLLTLVFLWVQVHIEKITMKMRLYNYSK